MISHGFSSLSVDLCLCVSGHPQCVVAGCVSSDQAVGVLPGQSGQCCGEVQDPAAERYVLEISNPQCSVATSYRMVSRMVPV